MNTSRFAGLVAVAGLAIAAHAQTTTVTFDSGNQGWDGPQGIGGATTVEAEGGNPGANLHTVFNNFGIAFTTSTNDAFLGNYSRWQSVTISADFKVERVFFFSMDVTRPLILELRDFNEEGSDFPWTSVWFDFGEISGGGTEAPWVTKSVTIDSTTMATLPPGWAGYGAEDRGGNPQLPENRTFASVLASVDEVAWSTLKPGWFFGFTDFDVRVDNIRITGNTAGCGLADVAGAGQASGSDGDLTADDIIVFIGLFFAADARGDVAGPGQTVGADSDFTADDIIVFINAFFAGCDE